MDSITDSISTLQKRAIFFLKSSFKLCSVLHTIISAFTPDSINFLTECCVGLVFNSPAADKYGNNVK